MEVEKCFTMQQLDNAFRTSALENKDRLPLSATNKHLSSVVPTRKIKAIMRYRHLDGNDRQWNDVRSSRILNKEI